MTKMNTDTLLILDTITQLTGLAALLIGAALLTRLWLETSFPSEPLSDDDLYEMGDDFDKEDAR